MVKKILFIGAIVALSLSGVASATPAATQGVHGAVESEVFGLANYKLVVNAERVPTGSIVGNIRFVAKGGTIPDAESMLDAQPIRLEIAGDSACVVGRVTSFSGDWGYTPVLFAVVIREVAGAPDLFGVNVALREDWPFDVCRTTPAIPINVGNFTITGGS
jgi:hypothetical protein